MLFDAWAKPVAAFKFKIMLFDTITANLSIRDYYSTVAPVNRIFFLGTGNQRGSIAIST
jgi:hypothetical protein